jgi:hypothetical protein
VAWPESLPPVESDGELPLLPFVVLLLSVALLLDDESLDVVVEVLLPA